MSSCCFPCLFWYKKTETETNCVGPICCHHAKKIDGSDFINDTCITPICCFSETRGSCEWFASPVFCKDKEGNCLTPLGCYLTGGNCLTPLGCHLTGGKCLTPVCCCESDEMFVSPVFCCVKKEKTEYLSGETKSKEINAYILENKLRSREHVYYLHTFGKYSVSTGPPVQTMSDEEAEKKVMEKILKEKLSSYTTDENKLVKEIMSYL